MKRKISLYIGDRLADLSEESLVLLNYTFEELTNPTIIKNSYSKTITLAGTPNNNDIFGYIYRADRVTQYGEGHTGRWFDSLRKTPFVIYDDKNEIIMRGYCRLDGIEKKGGNVSYKISLFGGLGSFFFAMSYNADGTKRTLRDLTYTNSDGVKERGEDMVLPYNEWAVRYAWEYLDEIPQSYKIYNIINFAPCYNGIPEDFDANKIYYKGNLYDNIPTRVVDEGLTYRIKASHEGALLKLSQPMTEWEVHDLRWYLQRPVISLKAIIDAMGDKETNGGFTLNVSADVPISGVWITLQSVPRYKGVARNWVYDVLGSSLTPAEYLINFAKLYGLVFVTDNARSTITIMTRREFFQKYGRTEDITERVDMGSVYYEPSVAKHKFYKLGGKEIEGAFAEQYRKNYATEYGSKTIDTGYDFDNETEELTKDTEMGNAVDVQEHSVLFAANDFTIGEQGGIDGEATIIPKFYGMDVELWNWDSAHGAQEETSKTFPVRASGYGGSQPFFPDFRDFFAKLQLHDSDNKPIDGANIFVCYNGMRETPTYPIPIGVFGATYSLTNDNDDMLSLNGDKPCWCWDASAIYIDRFPSFRKAIIDEAGGAVLGELFYGQPKELGYEDFTEDRYTSIYSQYWQKYLSDRYDADTKIMRCKVDLRGLKVDQELLGKFFWFDNSLWVLNKIENYSLTTDNLTDCEFIKVNDKNNYIQ